MQTFNQPLTKLCMTKLLSGAVSAWPAVKSEYYLPLVDNRSNANATRFSMRRIHMVSSIINGGTDPVAILIKQRNNSAGVLTIANFLNLGSVDLGYDIWMSHVCVQTQNGATVNTPDTQIQTKLFAPGELLLTSNDALGIYVSMTNANDRAFVMLFAEFQTE